MTAQEKPHFYPVRLAAKKLGIDIGDVFQHALRGDVKLGKYFQDRTMYAILHPDHGLGTLGLVSVTGVLAPSITDFAELIASERFSEKRRHPFFLPIKSSPPEIHAIEDYPSTEGMAPPLKKYVAREIDFHLEEHLGQICCFEIAHAEDEPDGIEVCASDLVITEDQYYKLKDNCELIDNAGNGVRSSFQPKQAGSL